MKIDIFRKFSAKQSKINLCPSVFICGFKFFLFFGFCFLCASCQKPASDSPAETVQRKTITLGDEPKAQGENLPDAIKIRVQISEAFDLRVKAGQKIRRGDVIADRRRERELLEKQIVRLREQRGAILLSIKRLDNLSRTKEESLRLEVLQIPASDFSASVAEIKRAETNLSLSASLVEKQKAKIEKLKTLRFENLETILSHEQVKLDELLARQAETRDSLELARAQFATTKANRAYVEQKDKLEIEKQKFSMREAMQNLEIQQAQLQANLQSIEKQMIDLEQQLARAEAVRASFAGTVEKIIWESQTNDEISIVIFIDVAGDTSESPKL